MDLTCIDEIDGTCLNEIDVTCINEIDGTCISQIDEGMWRALKCKRIYFGERIM